MTLSPEAQARLKASEATLHAKWGRTSGILIVAYAAAVFVDSTQGGEDSNAALFTIIESIFKRIVPKEHPGARKEVLADIDAHLVLMLKEAFPLAKVELRRGDEGIDIDVIQPLDDEPPSEGIPLH